MHIMHLLIDSCWYNIGGIKHDIFHVTVRALELFTVFVQMPLKNKILQVSQ